MTDRLDEIDGRLVQGHWDEDWAKEDVEWLLAEVKRLRALVADMRDVLILDQASLNYGVRRGDVLSRATKP